MSSPSIANRVETLERRMTPLALLPGQIANLTSIVANLAVQISQLREEMRAEFSAIQIADEEAPAELADDGRYERPQA